MVAPRNHGQRVDEVPEDPIQPSVWNGLSRARDRELLSAARLLSEAMVQLQDIVEQHDELHRQEEEQSFIEDEDEEHYDPSHDDIFDEPRAVSPSELPGMNAIPLRLNDAIRDHLVPGYFYARSMDHYLGPFNDIPRDLPPNQSFVILQEMGRVPNTDRVIFRQVDQINT